MEIQIKNISKKYGRHQVLKDITLSARGGSCIGILGANGCGKSTLLSILAGVQEGDSGQFLYNGEDLFQNRKKRTELVGYVPQGTPLIEELTAWDNLLLWYDRKELKKELSGGVLKMLGIDSFLKISVRKMSGGMKKRLSIGCAMANKPPILLLDEPTAALDLACKRDISEYLQQYKNAGGILLLTTHDSLELSLCDELYIMKDGVLQEHSYNGDLKELVDSL